MVLGYLVVTTPLGLVALLLFIISLVFRDKATAYIATYLLIAALLWPILIVALTLTILYAVLLEIRLSPPPPKITAPTR